MNNIEAARVMSVLDDLLANLRRISLVTAGTLESAEELEDVVGRELSSLLGEHRLGAARVQAEGQTALAASTLSICRAMRKNANLEQQLATLFHEERSMGMMELIAILEKVRARTQKSLTTTMEEENSEKDHFEEVCRREEKAGKERQTLEQQLRVERRERSKQVNYMTGMETRANSDLDQIKSTSVRMVAELQSETKASKEADKTSFVERETFLMAEVEKLRAELLQIEKVNREEEVALRSKKTKKEQEVLITLGEYDSDMSTKEKAYQDEKAVYEEVKQQLAEMEIAYKELQEEAEVAAEKNRKHQEEKARHEEKEQRLNRAACTIQRMWRSHNTVKGGKKEDDGKKKKGKGGKKK
eukprot:CAMPEP_0114239084 /NCGR_PEP_ID=MMETSP0058-20121206/8262_1 /TAXON_ID=36894 /ORGANISM="Pyramimonas parkeae, CCMP726" /LENGTH=357 /DNA_ID=CAMNT_0001351223 /DNA_START=139 /DNA_END=1212 /DNA_ORIENTATION=+